MKSPESLIRLLVALMKKMGKTSDRSRFHERVDQAVKKAFFAVRQKVLDMMYGDDFPAQHANGVLLDSYLDDVTQALANGHLNHAEALELRARRRDILNQMVTR